MVPITHHVIRVGGLGWMFAFSDDNIGSLLCRFTLGIGAEGSLLFLAEFLSRVLIMVIKFKKFLDARPAQVVLRVNHALAICILPVLRRVALVEVVLLRVRAERRLDLFPG